MSTHSAAPSAPAGALRTLGPDDASAVADLWNATFGDTHPLRAKAFATWWGSEHTDADLTFGLSRGGRLVGALLARAPRRAWSTPGVGHVSLLAVAPEAQGAGVGAELWRAGVTALRERGVRVVRLGADPGHLLPGVPVLAPAAAWRFFRARGLTFGPVECDLHLDLRPGPPTTPCDARLFDDDPEAVVAFVAHAFPGRWAEEVAAFAAHGCTLLGLERAGAVVAFAAAFGPDDAISGPSLTWSAALAGRPAGLGPLGVEVTQRGLGLGLGIVAAGARWHHARGAEDLLIDWTTLAPFYGRLGARVWRAYQRSEGVVDAAELANP
ncbi:MAG: GNAT family N-acetyltransferase [Trueperaceae bacterium]|nr:GNAT family N-acetyltransferase [Trueperaceae bacterium]